jgi:hypothetical protein
MAGTAKSNYLTVTEIVEGKHVTVFNKMFFNAGDMNKYIKAENFMEKYPKPQYTIYKECY